MRFLAAFLLVLAGCVVTLPGDHGLTADLAAETARMVVELRAAVPANPATDECDRCGGTGVLGDAASIRVTCPDCRGTGKKLRTVLERRAP
jgi:hypothetical protein